MDYGFCPRCGSKRPDGFRWCRKCGLDFQNPPKPEAVSQHEGLPPSRIDVRPVGDRRSLAQWTLDAFTVRCLATAGGLVGMVLGFFLFTAIGGALNMGIASLLLGLLGIVVGLALGIRIALGFLAR